MNSICVTTYNGERYIEQQIRSILTQIAPEDEVIVSDDGSTDKTLEIIESIGDKRIRIYHCKARNYKDNFENALKQAKGEIIFLADQDDVWLPDKYGKCVEALRTVDLVCTDCIVTDEQLTPVVSSYFAQQHSGPGIWKNIYIDTYCGACMAFRKRVLDAALPFPPTHEMGHDLWLGMVAETIGQVQFIETPYIYYRRHDHCITNQKATSVLRRSPRPFWRKVWSRFVMLYYIGKFRLTHER